MNFSKIKDYIFDKPNLSRPLSADFLRVVAAFSICLYHIWQQSWVSGGKLDFWNRTGALWVDVFIMLSAFCLFLPWANAKADGTLEQKQKSEKLSQFYLKRAIRLIPGYYLSIAFSFVVKVITDGCSANLIKDLMAHLTFTQMFFNVSYRNTGLNGVTWTLTVFALFYIFFPLLRNLFLKHPIITSAAMLWIQAFVTVWLLQNFENSDIDMLFNQFPAFIGVLCTGFIAASCFSYLGRKKIMENPYFRLICSLIGALSFIFIGFLLKYQTTQPNFKYSQIILRMPLCVLGACVVIFLGLGINLPLRKILGFLSSISFNLYLWHQMLAVLIKYKLKIPYWSGDTPPNMLYDEIWMHKYNLIAWCAALIAAVAVTYLFEKPVCGFLSKKLLKTAKQATFPPKPNKR